MEVQPSLCKVEETLSIISGKWKPIILLHLLYGGTKRFSELKQLIPSITQKMLTNQLRELEEAGVIRRVVYPQVPPKVEYSVTEYGETLKTLLFKMHEWGIAHVDRLNQD
ncbi:DNA-binding HxlR family transcriptional regulator [Paenibacillus rhizosphaerae]|uniref:DNA-binding HxlR family transcriptional regulator n=1 Tax=Paenibacillus rhizosphaerae TaxID=297318 RepID=A0A839TV93_9BACL|nr:helix-turn-helix domain-containing protein [Paenibacillus rhizosphaerae]MBB3128607.1 DNA-binding HxlR family transcriptional regulator [Paenibacillus rhizosphaerae]